MLTDDQSISDFPVWALPYIRIADLAKGEFTLGRESGVRTPPEVVRAHVTAIVAAATVKQIAGAVKDGGALSQAASAALTRAIDDCGNNRPKPWPHPPRHIGILEVATELAVAAAAMEDKGLSGELAAAAQTLAGRARG